MMVATHSVKHELSEKGFKNIALWGKGIEFAKQFFWEQSVRSFLSNLWQI